MKRTLLAIMVAGICAAPSLAQAASSYVSANVGLGFPSDSTISAGGISFDNAISYKTGVPFGAAIGMRGDQYRVEAAFSYQSSDVDRYSVLGLSATPAAGTKVSITSYMVNAYYDYTMKDSSITPYVMGGLGGATINPNGGDFTGSSSKSVFAWQLGAGIGFKASENVVVDLGYRYLKPSSYTVSDAAIGNVDLSAATSNILLGVRYNF